MSKSTIVLRERKPLSDVGQIIQPLVQGAQTDDKNSTNDADDSLCSSVYSPMSVDHEKSILNSSLSLTAHRLSCDIDTYTCELYSYLRNVEVIQTFYFFG